MAASDSKKVLIQRVEKNTRNKAPQKTKQKHEMNYCCDFFHSLRPVCPTPRTRGGFDPAPGTKEARNPRNRLVFTSPITRSAVI